MKLLNSADRRSLRGRAHALKPVVIVSGTGLSGGVMAEIERCLQAHELIKIRVLDDDRLHREDLLAQICERTRASPVQHIGKILVVYLEKPDSPAPTPAAAAKAPPRHKPVPDRRSEAPRAGARSSIPGSTPGSPPRRPPARPTSRRRP
jgi:putative YhbY family RNA-binding protein